MADTSRERNSAAAHVPAIANASDERAAAAGNVPFASANASNERAAAAGNVPFASANATNERAAAASNVPSVIHTPLNDRAAAFLNIHAAKNTLLNCNVARFDWPGPITIQFDRFDIKILAPHSKRHLRLIKRGTVGLPSPARFYDGQLLVPGQEFSIIAPT